jgi:hypothetical protein
MLWDRESLGIESFDDPFTLVEAGGAQKPESHPLQYVEARALEYDYHMGVKTFSSAQILELMQRHGFQSRWHSWVALLFTSTSSRALLNGIHGSDIIHGRGLRQGDPSFPIVVRGLIPALPRRFPTKIFHVC